MKKIYFAPMEGVTGYIYRNVHAAYFKGVDQYYTPFLAPHQNRDLKGKELRDVLPENNKGISLVPQILTGRAEDFNRTARQLKEMGYQHVNLNLGCPSGTVVAKHKGSGMLAEPEVLNEFLYQISDGLTGLGMELSVKSRIGIDNIEEFPAILEIFNGYSFRELIIHPRLQKDYYKNSPHMEAFDLAAAKSTNRLCYNGDLFNVSKCRLFLEHYQQVNAVMLGRGLLQNPFLAQNIYNNEGTDLKRLREFHDRLLSDYQQVLYGDKNVLFKMKELWFYFAVSFQNSDKYMKKIKKVQSISEYRMIVDSVFRECTVI